MDMKCFYMGCFLVAVISSVVLFVAGIICSPKTTLFPIVGGVFAWCDVKGAFEFGKWRVERMLKPRRKICPRQG